MHAIAAITRRLDEDQARTVLALLADVIDAMYAYASDPDAQLDQSGREHRNRPDKSWRRPGIGTGAVETQALVAPA